MAEFAGNQIIGGDGAAPAAENLPAAPAENDPGSFYFDATIGALVWGDGTNWVAPGFLAAAVAETTTARTLALADIGKVVECTNASAVTVTVPTNASVAFPIGSELRVYSAGAGGVTVAAAGGVTLRGTATAAQFAYVKLRKRATNEWVCG